MKSRALSAILSLSLAMLASCGGEAPAVETTAPEETTPAETEAPVKSLLRDTTDAEIAELGLEGYEFNIFQRAESNGWRVTDLVSPDANGEILNDAIYNRYQALQEKFGFTMNISYSPDQHAGDLANFVLAGDDTYDVAFPSIARAATFAQGGVSTDLYSLDYFDIDSGVWSKMFCDEVEWGGKLYFAAGHISINSYQAVRAFYFNKNLHTEYKLDDIYTLVRDGRWTLDVVREMAAAVSKDLNGDSEMKAMDDRWGMAWQSSISGLSMFYGSDARITEKNSDKIPELTLGDSHSQEVFEKIQSMMAETDVFCLGDGPDMKTTFKEGRSFLYTEVLGVVEQMRDSNIEFGIVPAPKYDEAQEEYIQFIDDWCVSPAVIPITAKNLERSGFLIQLLAETGLEYIKPAYYDVCLTAKYARDEDSVEMLDIIVSNFRLDNAVLYNWGGIFSKLVPAFTQGDGLASLVAGSRSAVESAIAKTASEMAENAQ